jgi:hypothetical protein
MSRQGLYPGPRVASTTPAPAPCTEVSSVARTLEHERKVVQEEAPRARAIDRSELRYEGSGMLRELSRGWTVA